MPIYTEYQTIICHTRNGKKYDTVMMTYLSEDEEISLDKGEILEVTRGKHHFTIGDNNVYCYGVIDFTKGSSDMQAIEYEMNWLNYLHAVGIHIPSDYDFENHVCRSPFRYYRYTETWSPSQLAQYKYACLGKPERCVIFKINH